ncbi:hypothetical protein HG531_001206 [Fusarium graminearum]|nr:hypothetical protein HG531_001206 [Fusarium graminearum]
MMTPEKILRVMRLLHSQQLSILLLTPVPRCPVMHYIGAFREITVWTKLIYRFVGLLRGQGACIPQHKRRAKTRRDGCVFWLHAAKVALLQDVLETITEQLIVLFFLATSIEILKVEAPGDFAKITILVVGGVDEEGGLCANLVVELELPRCKANPHVAEPLVTEVSWAWAEIALLGDEDTVEAAIGYLMSADGHREDNTPDTTTATAHGPEELWILLTTGDLLVDNGIVLGITADLKNFNLQQVINTKTHRRCKWSMATTEMEANHANSGAPTRCDNAIILG